MDHRFDLAVIGAGPAGSHVAALLARRGARVALIDGSHPREKPCGGGITGRALALVRDAVPLDRLAAVRIDTARFGGARTSATVRLDALGDAALVVASRAEFDGLMYAAAERAGASLIRARATALAREAGGFRVETSDRRTLRASWLVGADGANSLVRRSLARPFLRDQISIATGFFAHAVTSREVLVDVVDDPPGYIWSFPRPDHLAIGICTQADAGPTADALRARVAAWIQQTRIAAGAPLQPYSWPIPSLTVSGLGALVLGGDGWLTIGDAAGLVDPITREGIYFALQSAAFAADALSGDARAALRQFNERVRAEILDELTHAARLKAGFFQPRFTRLLIEALRHSPRIRQIMADLVAGTQPYRTLKWRLLKTLELSLAWRVVTARDIRRGPAHARSAG